MAGHSEKPNSAEFGFHYDRFVCGRFVQAMPPEKIVDYFGVEPSSATAVSGSPNYNVAPSQEIINVLAIDSSDALSNDESRRGADLQRVAARIRWGMIFPWARSSDEGPRPINARVESVVSKPAFRRAFARQRSVVPADGFYEWKKLESAGKTPYYIRSESGDPLAIAAIWSDWKAPDGDRVVRTCALITVPANPALSVIHDRMPALLSPDQFDFWLDPGNDDIDGLARVLRSASESGLEWYPVSRRVNSPAQNDADLIRPAGD